MKIETEGNLAARLKEEAKEWDRINAYGRTRAKALGIKPQDVNRIVHEERHKPRQRTKKAK